LRTSYYGRNTLTDFPLLLLDFDRTLAVFGRCFFDLSLLSPQYAASKKLRAFGFDGIVWFWFVIAFSLGLKLEN
jgi:hypothetical protein